MTQCCNNSNLTLPFVFALLLLHLSLVAVPATRRVASYAG